jgi:hypothetical protein
MDLSNVVEYHWLYALKIHRTLCDLVTIYINTVYLITKAIPVCVCVSYFDIKNLESKNANFAINFGIMYSNLPLML